MSIVSRIAIVFFIAIFVIALPVQEAAALSKADYIRNGIDYYDPDSIGCQAAGSGNTSNNMPVKQQVEQTLFIGFDMGAFSISKIKSTILKYKPGGVFFTDVSAANAKKLNKSFFNALNKKLPTPLIVSSDDEGGAVNRFYNNKYSAKAMGKLSNNKVSQIGSATGVALQKHGVNLDLAPVLDLDAHKHSNEISRDGRSFSSDPKVVAAKAGAYADGLTSTGVGVTFKHFPGLRTETTNTDTGKNTYKGTIASLSKDIQPYKKLASTAKSAVMLSNMYITAWGKDPASINKQAVSYLRGTVKFNGPILTDDLSALGKYSGMSMQTIVQKAYNAGVTMPLFSYKSDSQMDKIITTSASNVGQGNLSESYNDTMAFKSSLGLDTGDTQPVSPVQPEDVTPTPIDTGGGSASGQNKNLVNIYGYFLAKGLSPEQAAGGVGNISQESGGSPTIIQGGKHSNNPASAGGGGWGIIQWTPGKKVINIAKQAGVSGPIYELSTQEDIVWWHLNNTTPTGVSHFIRSYKKITDVTKATESWEEHMEGAGVPAMANRIKAAKLALATYPRTPSQVTSSCGDDSSTGFDGSNLPGKWTKQDIFKGHVNYQQCDPAWGDTKIAHGTTTICHSACVPFSLANIIQNFGTNIDPSKLAIESGERGLTDAGGSLMINVVKYFAPKYNLRYEVLKKGDVSALKKALNDGAQVMLGGRGAAPWITNIGHVESLWKYIPSDNTFYVSDPGNQSNSKAWSVNSVLAGAYNYNGPSRPNQLAIAIYKK